MICDTNFEVVYYRREITKTCSPHCLKLYRSLLLEGNKRAAGQPPNSGTFQSGLTPWNKGTVGVMQPNSGSFQTGRESETKQPVGSVTIRKDKQGRDRAWVKVADNSDPYDWKPRAVVVWEKLNGPIPDGMIVHHKDRDTMNDIPNNLELMDRAGHLMEHRPEYEERRRNAASEATKERHASARAECSAVE